MSSFARTLAIKVEDYVTLRRSLGYAFQKQAATLRALVRVRQGRAARWSPHAGHGAQFRVFRGKALPTVALFGTGSFAASASISRYTTHGRRRSIRAHYPEVRAIPPPRILTDDELGSLILACRRVSPDYPERAAVLTALVGLLASTGLRSGEALRLDRADVDLIGGALHIRKTKFRKDRLVPIHPTTLTVTAQL